MEHTFLNILYTARFKQSDIDSLQNNYPNTYRIVNNVYGITDKSITFIELEKYSRNLPDNIENELRNELKNMIKNGSSMDRSILRWYLSLNCHMYVFRNPYKILFLKFIFKFLPKHKVAKVKKEKCEKINKMDFSPI